MRKLLAFVLGLILAASGAQAQTKINNLNAAAASAGADFFPVSQGAANATKQTVTALFATPPGIGGTTAAAGAFTTLSASSTVSGTGFSTYLASPPAIGGTAAAAGSFTTLSASSTVSGTGFSNYLASPPAIGGTSPAAGSFTALSITSTITASGLSGGIQVSCIGLNSGNQFVLSNAGCGSGLGGGTPGGTTGQVQYNNSGSFGGFTVSGDGTLNTSTGAITITKTNGTAFAAVATSGSASDLSTGTLPAARLPNPSASTLGGIESFVAVSHEWINTISTSGVPSATQPAFSDISGAYTFAQGPTIATNTVLGNSSGSTAAPSAQTVGAGLVMNANGLQTIVGDVTKTANYTVATGDMSGLINFNGTFTLTIPAISSTVLTTGMSVSYQNQGSGNVTISSTPTINGLNNTTVPPGGFGTLVGNGSTLDFTGLSTPTTSAMGGVRAKDCSSGSQFVQKINTDGTISCASPSGSGTVSVVSSGTLTLNAPVIGGGTQLISTVAAMTNGQVLIGVTSSAPAPQTISGDCTLNASGVIACFATPATVAKGGTGLGTLTAHAVLLGEGTSNVGFATIGTSGRLLIDQGASTDPSFNAMSGDATITNAGVITIGAGAVTGSKIASSVALAGSPTTTTQSAKDNSTKIATTAYVDAPTPLTTGTSVSLTAPRQYFECTGTCTITPPTPAAGYEFCVRNADNVATVITFAAIASTFYEKTTFVGYGTVNTASTSGGAAGDKLCILGKDSTHYDVASFNGTWSMP